MAMGEAPILIKKVKKAGGHAHHGGAWKVAYADFVTAMMAFFLLMWLINTTSPEQKRGIADYFAPASISESTSGSGGILGGTALGEDGAQGAGSQAIIEQMAPESPNPNDGSQQDAAKEMSPEASTEALREAILQREQAAFASAAQSLRQALQDMPELAELSKNILIDQTPEGLRIAQRQFDAFLELFLRVAQPADIRPADVGQFDHDLAHGARLHPLERGDKIAAFDAQVVEHFRRDRLIFQIELGHDPAHRLDRGFPGQCGNVRADEPVRGAGQFLQIDPFTQRHPAGVNREDFPPPGFIRHANDDFAVEPAGPR